jgi:hypothetical protein
MLSRYAVLSIRLLPAVLSCFPRLGLGKTSRLLLILIRLARPRVGGEREFSQL